MGSTSFGPKIMQIVPCRLSSFHHRLEGQWHEHGPAVFQASISSVSNGVLLPTFLSVVKITSNTYYYQGHPVWVSCRSTTLPYVNRSPTQGHPVRKCLGIYPLGLQRWLDPLAPTPTIFSGGSWSPRDHTNDNGTCPARRRESDAEKDGRAGPNHATAGSLPISGSADGKANRLFNMFPNQRGKQ